MVSHNRFPNSDLGTVVTRKLILPKYSAILKRRANKGVALQDLDKLQLELESLLLSTIKRRKILLKECPVLEEKKSLDDCELSASKQKTTNPCNVLPNKICVRLTPTAIKFVIPDSQFRKPMPAIHRKRGKTEKFTKSLEHSSALELLAAQLTAPKSSKNECLKENQHLVTPDSSESKPSRTRKSTDPKLSEKKSRDLKTILAHPNKFSEEITLPANTFVSDSLEKPNNLKGNVGLAGSNDCDASLQKQNLKVARAKRLKKPSKPPNTTRFRNNRDRSRQYEPSRKYWQSISHICKGIFEPDLKSLDELLKSQESIEKSFKEPSTVGPHFATTWAQTELSEEKIAGSEVQMPRKSSGLVSEDVLSLMKRAEKSIDRENTPQDFGADPLYSRLLTSLIDEKIIPSTEHKHELLTASHPQIEDEIDPNFSAMESDMRADLVNVGVISRDSIVRADTRRETDIDVEIKRMQDYLRTVTKCNAMEINRVIKLTKLELHKQNLTRQLVNKGREIEKAYQSILALKKKSEPVGKQIKKALTLVKERETILWKLQKPIEV